MSQMSHQIGTRIAETTEVAAARRSGPVAPKPRPATGRSATVDLRVAVAKEKSVTARRVAAEEQAAAEKWDKTDRGVPLDVE